MKSWEELTPLERAHETYSDMYKDAYGFRPRNDVSHWTLEDFEKEFEQLSATIMADLEREKKEQEQAVKNFEDRVTATMKLGAGDRETAIRWIDTAEDAGGDREYLCFLLNLPYGYFKKAA